MKTKQLTIRVNVAFHRALVEYCTANMIPVSTFVVQQTAKAIGYKPRPATPRTGQTPLPVVPVVQQPLDTVDTVEDYPELDESDWDMEDLQRRAAAAPVKPLV